MLVNMAVWHTTDREDNQYLCLQVGILQHHRCWYIPLLFICWISVCWSLSLPSKSSTRFKRTRVASEEVCVHWQLPAVEPDRKSHDCFFLIFVHAGSCHISCKGDTSKGLKNQRNSSNHCPGVTPGLSGIRGQGSYREIARWGFRLPFSLTLRHFSSTVVNCLPSL